MSRKGIVWDACGLLNLIATGHASGILKALSVPSFLVREVSEREILYLRSSEPDADKAERQEVTIRPLLDAQDISLIEMTPDEQMGFISWASLVDDGEAYSLAVAEIRGLQVATDDKATINHMSRQVPPISVLTTPEWLKQWADIAQPDPAILREAIQKIVRCARYRPHPNHPLKSWWELSGQ